MADPSGAEVFVSLQARGHTGSLVEGHRATGILLGPDVAVIPAFAVELMGQAAGAEVVLVPVPYGGQAEAIVASYVELHRVEADSEAIIAIVRLAQPSGLPSSPNVASDRRDDFQDALAAKGDLVAALEAVGVRTDAYWLDPETVLDGIVPIRPPAERVFLHSSFEGQGLSICKWVSFCFAPSGPSPVDPG